MKKVCSILLALIMVIAILPAAFATGMFTDLDGHWAKADIEELAAAGVINGMGDGTYAPENPVTRSQFIKLLTVAVGATGTVDGVFQDAASHWSAQNVSAALAAGILKAEDYPSGAFEPDKEITRDEAALWISRALGLTGEGTPDFTDVADITNKTAVYQTVQAGIINGMGDGTFGPKNTTTRAQSAVLIKRVMNYKPAVAPTAAPTAAPTEKPADTIKNEVKYTIPTVHEFNIAELVKIEGDNILWAANDSRFTERVNVGDLVIIAPTAEYPYGVAGVVLGKNHHDYDTDYPLELIGLKHVEKLTCQRSKSVKADGLSDAKLDVTFIYQNGKVEKLDVTFTATGKVEGNKKLVVAPLYGPVNAELELSGNKWTATILLGTEVIDSVSGTF